MKANRNSRVVAGTGMALFAACILVAGCSQEQGYDGPIRGTILGTVSSQEGGPVPGCLVSDGINQAVTDEAGRFRIADVWPQERVRLSLQATGFLRTFAFASIEGWETATVSVVMVPFGRPHSFLAEEGITVMERRAEGAYYVSIPPNGVVDAQGELVSGEIEIHISPISLQGSPGDLTGIVYQEGEPHVVPLVSYKMTDITLTRPGDADLYDDTRPWGKKLNLAPGVTATVELPLPQDMPLAQRPPIGKQILWWFWDPAVGHWVQDAIGTVKKSIDGSGQLAWRAKWTHFSRHGVLMPKKDRLGLAPDIAAQLSAEEREVLVANVDDPPPPRLTCVEGTVKDKMDNPIQGAEVWVEGITRNMRTRFQSDSEGRYRVGPVVVGNQIEIIAQVMVGDQKVEGRETYTVQGPGQPEGFAFDLESALCEEGPDIIIPVCSAGGDLVAVSWKVGGNQTTTYNLAGANAFVEGAVGQFYEPYGEVEFCEPKLDRIEEDSCMSLSAAAMIGLEMKPPKSLDAGPWVSLQGGVGVTMQREIQPGDYQFGNLVIEQEDIFYRYDNDDESKALVAGPYTVTAAGAQPGQPPFSADEGLIMPDRLELLGEVEPLVRLGESLDLNWKLGNDDQTRVIILIVPENARSGIACVVQDDGEFEVPAESLKELPQGMSEYVLMVMRTRKNTFRLPQGTIARARGMSGIMMANKIEGEGTCGDGKLDPGELCDANCPEACDDGDACTQDDMNGSPDTCDAVCSNEAISACIDGDGCCPADCNYTLDSDCRSDCGNGIVEGGEKCDGNCPVSCDDGNACTIDELSGAAEFCDAMCSYLFITACRHGDGCCPAGCSPEADDDCNSSCGDGILEGGELCDGDCPMDCDDGNACTEDILDGSAATCDASCSSLLITICRHGDGCCPAGCSLSDDSDCAPSCGNGAMEAGEVCDGNCPSKCDDNDACTEDLLLGSAANCDAECNYRPITICIDGDGCCPLNCIEAGDTDCRTEQVFDLQVIEPLEAGVVENPVTFRAMGSSEVVRVVYRLSQGELIGASSDAANQFLVQHSFAQAGPQQVLIEARDQTGKILAQVSRSFIVGDDTLSPPACEGFSDAAFIAPEVCDGPGGQTTTEKAPNGLYATSWFGCYAQADGTVAFDPADNCQFACGSMGLCDSSLSGPACQAQLRWFAAGADRFGCGARIRVSNCNNGRSVILAVLDRGPNCQSVEREIAAPVLDMSKPAMEHLFEGATYGAWDLAAVVVEEVPSATPLGPSDH